MQHGRKSISGGIAMLGGGPVMWWSSKQATTSLSTMESEFQSLAKSVQELLWLRYFLFGLKIDISKPSTILIDNQATIDYVRTPNNRTRAKHIDIRYNFVRDYHEREDFKLSYVPTRDNLADALTKPLAYAQHWYLANSYLGIRAEDAHTALGKHFPHSLYMFALTSAFARMAH
jgi:hypothetical protein